MATEHSLIHRINSWTTVPDPLVRLIAAALLAAVMLEFVRPWLASHGVPGGWPLAVAAVVLSLALFFAGPLWRRMRR